ncbi:MAG: hypothetical protein RIM72_22370 [Alphaproteobacteria bacterium]
METNLNFDNFLTDIDRYNESPWLMAADSCLGVGGYDDRQNAYSVIGAISVDAGKDFERAVARFGKAVLERPALFACIVFYLNASVIDGVLSQDQANDMSQGFAALLPSGVPDYIIGYYFAVCPGDFTESTDHAES